MSLCVECGLCCDGTLFQRVPLAVDEAARLPRALTLADGQLVQPCGALDGCRCTIYADRPSTCRTYACLVLTSLETGRISERDARGALAEVRAARAEVARLNAGALDERQALTEAREKLARGEASDDLRAALSRLARLALLLQLPPAAR
ncbi:MAG: YkgJ family cysteine cluster protein [Myxococcota bacterium]